MTDNSRSALCRLSPPAVWQHFSRLTAIPRVSGHEQAVVSHILTCAAAAGARGRTDSAGNVIIDIAAHTERKGAPGVILQGHLDMVPATEPGYEHDFLTMGVTPRIEDGYVCAEHTSLGADNGIGIAIMLALMDDSALRHGPLRLIMTVDEETSMRGAHGLDPKDLSYPYLINLDSEENGCAYVSCAGSEDFQLTFTPEWILPEGCSGITAELKGLSGGHSGTDINAGFANAIREMAGMLVDLSSTHDFFVCALNGGRVRNAIPSGCTAQLAVPDETAEVFCNALRQAADTAAARFKGTDPGFQMLITKTPAAKTAMDYHDGVTLLKLLTALPDGVLRAWDIDKNVPETSINTGLIRTLDDSVQIMMMARSLNETGLDAAGRTVSSLCALLPDSVLELERLNRHPCWNGKPDAHLFDALNAGADTELKLTAMHAGLECAVLFAKNPALRQISTGPEILQPHSYKERVQIAGVEAVYQRVRRALEII